MVLVHDDRHLRIGLDRGLDQVLQEVPRPAYFRAPAEACMITGASSSLAAAMIA